MDWSYENNIVTEDTIPDGAVGFVYKIIHIATDKFYIGKKALASVRRIKLGKKELQLIKDARKLEKKGGRLPSKKTVRKDSGWVDYYSSNTTIQEMVKDGKADEFKREIIKFCFSKKSLSYWELYYMFKHNVLGDENSYNDNISGTYYRKDLN